MKGQPFAEGCNTLGKRRRKAAGVSPAGRKQRTSGEVCFLWFCPGRKRAWKVRLSDSLTEPWRNWMN